MPQASSVIQNNFTNKFATITDVLDTIATNSSNDSKITAHLGNFPQLEPQKKTLLL
jgi:hypothetical protein